MDVETFQALGLHRPLEAARSRMAGTMEDFARFLQPPEDEQYHPCPEASPAGTVPRGEVRLHKGWAQSAVYPGTGRNIWIYRPQQLSSAADLPGLIVFQDGHGYLDMAGPVRAPAVLDSLIHAGELPATIAVFIDPGSRLQPTTHEPDDQRSVEYDTLTGAYGTFLLDEVLPFAESEVGRRFSADPAMRMTCGISSGGICAFSAAWFRPQSFGRVLSHCGSFTNIRGGHNYPFLIRTGERKAIRVFLTTGAWDLDHAVGNWPLANQEMASALEYAGYDYRFAFGEGGHSLRHGGAVFAESLRWLCR